MSSNPPTIVQLDEHVHRTDLPGGPVVLTEKVPGVRSAGVGIWVRWGASHEPDRLMGISHLIEHMVFKGTERRSAREIALEIEGIGGSLDAYTTREHTAYFARVLDEHLPIAIDVLADLVQRPVFRDEDLDLEKSVVLEEIAGVDDAPEDLVFDLHAKALWGSHPYGNPVLGTNGTVTGIGRKELLELWESRYRPSSFIIAAAGNLEHERFLEYLGRHLDLRETVGSLPNVPEPHPESPGQVRHSRDSSQAHICLGSATFPHGDPRRYAAILVSMALGGGMSSRLFQRIREELGLAYAVYSFQSFYSRAGVAGVYMATRPESAERAIEEAQASLATVAASGLESDELLAVKNQAKGQLVLSLESTSSRLHRLAGVTLYDEPYRTLDELTALIDGVSAEEVAEVCQTYYAPDRQTVVRLGPDPDRAAN